MSEQVTLTSSGYGWSYTGDGSLSGTSGSSTTLTAGNEAGSVTVNIGARGRICTANSITFTIDAPQQVLYERYTGVQHVQGEAELAMRSHIYFLPSNVSFYNTSWQEEQAYFSANGAWLCSNGQPHTTDTSVPMSTTVDPVNGTLGAGYDDEGSGYCPAQEQFQPSSESVTIPTDYFSNYDGSPFEIGTFTPIASEDSFGNLSLTKADASANTTVFSPDSGY